MKKHEFFGASIIIDSRERLNEIMTKEEMDEYIKANLIMELAKAIVENNNFSTISKIDGPTRESSKYIIELVAIKPSDYRLLRDTIWTHDFRVMRDGKVIPLLDLL